MLLTTNKQTNKQTTKQTKAYNLLGGGNNLKTRNTCS